MPEVASGKAFWRVNTTFEGWQVVPVRAGPPLLHQGKLLFDGKPVGVAYIRFGCKLSVPAYAATQGFQGMAVSGLCRLMQLVGIPKEERPKLHYDIIVRAW